jgi:hypothetical protein
MRRVREQAKTEKLRKPEWGARETLKALHNGG